MRWRQRKRRRGSGLSSVMERGTKNYKFRTVPKHSTGPMKFSTAKSFKHMFQKCTIKKRRQWEKKLIAEELEEGYQIMDRPKLSKPLQGILDGVEGEAKKVMARVGLTDEDLNSIPQGASFEDFSKALDKIMTKKKQS